MAEEGMGQRFPSPASPPLGTLANQQPLTPSLSCLDFSFTLSALFLCLWPLSSQHNTELWFPSLAFTSFLIYHACP